MNTKRITLAIAILSTVATALAVVGEVLPPTWALLVASLGAGAYGVVRALQKVAAGATLKALLSTTEAWGAGLVILAAIISAAAGVVPAKWAGPIAAASVLMLKLARMLQVSEAPGAQPAPAQPELRVVQPAAPLAKTEPTPVTVPNPTGGQKAGK